MIASQQTGQPCWVCRRLRKPKAYLALADPHGFEGLPEALRRGFGAPELVLELTLRPRRRLARADSREVLAALSGQGFYPQLLPELEPRLYRGE